MITTGKDGALTGGPQFMKVRVGGGVGTEGCVRVWHARCRPKVENGALLMGGMQVPNLTQLTGGPQSESVRRCSGLGEVLKYGESRRAHQVCRQCLNECIIRVEGMAGPTGQDLKDQTCYGSPLKLDLGNLSDTHLVCKILIRCMCCCHARELRDSSSTPGICAAGGGR